MSHTTPLWADTLAAFDTETTGLDTSTARIVTATVVLIDANGVVTERYDWMINPGVPIPAAAVAVHGISTEIAQRSGADPQVAIAQIIERLQEMINRGFPLAVYNAPFDLSLLASEAARYGLDWLTGLDGVVDPLVIDKQVDRYRKGKRQLGTVAEHYGVTLENAHDAGADAIATAHIAQAIAQRHAEKLPDGLSELHRAQQQWAQEQAASLQAYFDRIGRVGKPVDGTWPVRGA